MARHIKTKIAAGLALAAFAAVSVPLAKRAEISHVLASRFDAENPNASAGFRQCFRANVLPRETQAQYDRWSADWQESSGFASNVGDLRRDAAEQLTQAAAAKIACAADEITRGLNNIGSSFENMLRPR